MTNYITLDNNEHADLKVVHEYSAETGARVNQVRVFVSEFEELQKEYPIFFRRTETGEYYAVTLLGLDVALLGLDVDENLFLDEPRWDARYTPAAIRKGPFQIGLVKNGATESIPTIKIDLDDVRVGKEAGNALFQSGGGLTPYLQHISKTLQSIHIGMNSEAAFFEELEKLSLIEPIVVQLSVSETKSYTVPDIFSISKDKLLNLEPSDLTRLHKSGLLSLCQWVLTSLGNTNNLLERKLKKSSNGA